MKRVLFFTLILLLFINANSFAVADPNAFYYNDITGVNVKYTNLWEISGTDPGTALYNTPTYGGGDCIEFDDLFFSAYASGASGSDSTDGTLNGKIESKPNHYIDVIQFEEYGDYDLSGFSNDAYVSVTNKMYIKVKEIDFQDVEDFTVVVDMVITPSDGTWSLSSSEDNPGSAPEITDDWSGILDVDVTQIIRDEGYATGFATEVDFTMENNLTALSQDGTEAFIAKKETDGMKITTCDVPEPATIAVLGLGGLFFRRRKA